MKTVAFYQPFMNERGTNVAMFNYASYNEKILGNKSVFIHDSLDERNVSMSIDKIRSKFPLYDIACGNFTIPPSANNRSQKIDDVIEKNGITHIYLCKSGYNDGVIPQKAKSLIHVMGMVPDSEKHGDVYAYVSYFSARECSPSFCPVLPYMVDILLVDEDLREELGIPKDAVVFGRHGGMDTFDPWCHGIIAEVLKRRQNVYFVFLNTPTFIQHPRVKFLPATTCDVYKTKFINTCDAMIHVRWVGETFGMACAEFSARNKPVITDSRSPERNHIEILGKKGGIYFNSAQSFFDILMSFVPKPGNYNCYFDYRPQRVMEIFDEIFLK